MRRIVDKGAALPPCATALHLVMLSSSDKFPLILGITTITSAQGYPVYNLTIMGAFLTALPLLILFSFLQRYLAAHLTGAIK